MKIIFVTGTGTDVGKTVVSAILTEALQADYWKPVQAGFDAGTDGNTVAALISNKVSKLHPEVYKLKLPASPHIAARQEGIRIELENIVKAFRELNTDNEWLVVEGAGGLMVPLNDQLFVADLIRALDARAIIVSRNYLGSINHSLLTSKLMQAMGIDILGWIFNDRYMDYEEEIVEWSAIPRIGSIPFHQDPDRRFVAEQSAALKKQLMAVL